ncbi:ATP-dependent helicase [Aestuariimicrobium ganziense]|uniref:ATP-dependent helicase n=1 Tax=Aestuariimicrobium ganziense TaxID=2773677 RepID=UPI0019404F3C|nr:ATP-dependent DNA helicase [Aestuariimicrobium ganziense]
MPSRTERTPGEPRPGAPQLLARTSADNHEPLALDPQQQAAVEAAGGGDVLVVGGPGTGKTSLLVEGVRRAVADGTPLGRQLVLAHTRPAAQALRTQIIRTLGGAELAPAVMTPHALAHGLLRRFGDHDEWGSAPTLLSAPEQEFRVRELLAHTDTTRWPDDLASAARTRGFASELRTAMARIRQLGLDPSDVALLAEQSGRPAWTMLAEFFEEYLEVLDAEHVLDYAELVHRGRLLMTQPQVAQAWAAEIEQVWCDDMGEYDPSQVQLVADLAHVGARVWATTDPFTGVFGFRGADDRLVLDFTDLFRRVGSADPSRVWLGENHRNSSAVVQAMTATAHRLPRPAGFGPGTAQVGRPAGRVQAWVCDSPGAEADHIVQRLRSARLTEGLEWSQMAVITRSGHGTLPMLARTLSAHGVPVQMAADEVALSEAMAVTPLVLALTAVTVEPQEWTADLVLDLVRSPLAGLHGLGLRRLGRRLRSGRQSEESAAEPPTSAEGLVRLLRDPDGHADVTDTPEGRDAVRLGQLLRRCHEMAVEGATAAQVVWELWSGTDWPRRLTNEAVSSSETAPRANRDLDAICALFDVANPQTTWTGVRGIRALLSEVAAQQIPADRARESDPRQRGVTLTTAHRVKGLSWPLVVVAGVQEGEWPATRRRSSLLDASRLTREGLADPEPFSALVAAERRLFLLATSRATDELLVTCVHGTEGEGDQPSRFVEELPVEPVRLLGRPSRPLTVQGLVAELRRAATDGRSSPALRQAAASRLAVLAASDDHQGGRLAPDADPGRWWGLLDHTDPEQPLLDPRAPISLSGSELETLLTCPRRWFLSRPARAETVRGSASSLGSVVHVLVDHASSEGIDLETLQAHLDHVWDRIPFDAAWLSSSERSEAEAALERYAAWAAANTREVVGTEVSFSLDLDLGDEQVELRGVVDRLERDSQGQLHVVDFKTGRQRPTKAQAEASPQLGLYQLATQLGAFDDLTDGERRTGGAELVYLRHGATTPSVLTQPSLDTRPHLEQQSESVNWMVDAVSEAVATVRSEQFEARPCDGCRHCPFLASCPAKAIAGEVGR